MHEFIFRKNSKNESRCMYSNYKFIFTSIEKLSNKNNMSFNITCLGIVYNKRGHKKCYNKFIILQIFYCY